MPDSRRDILVLPAPIGHDRSTGSWAGERRVTSRRRGSQWCNADCRNVAERLGLVRSTLQDRPADLPATLQRLCASEEEEPWLHRQALTTRWAIMLLAGDRIHQVCASLALRGLWAFLASPSASPRRPNAKSTATFARATRPTCSISRPSPPRPQPSPWHVSWCNPSGLPSRPAMCRQRSASPRTQTAALAYPRAGDRPVRYAYPSIAYPFRMSGPQ